MKKPKIIIGTFFLVLFHSLVFAQTQEIYRIKSPENSLYLEVSAKNTNRDGVKVFLKKYSTSSKQKWSITKNYNNYYTIKNLANGKVMSIYPYEINKDGNSLILNSPNSSDHQKWIINKNFSADNVVIENVQNSKVLAPDKNSYRNLAKIVLNKRMSNRKQSLILVPVGENSNTPNYNFTGIYENESSKLQMEIRDMGRNTFKAIFTGNCSDESLTGSINSSGVLIIPLRSNNNAQLEIRKQETRFNVKITNIGQLSSRSYGKCNGGQIEGYYRKQNNNLVEGFSGIFQLSYGNQQLEIIKTGFDGYKAVFSGDCRAETLVGKINRNGVLEIPLRGGYNDRLEISRQGNRIKVYATNKNIMNNACGSYTIEGYYDKQSWNDNNNSTDIIFSGKYQLDMQFVNLINMGGNRYKAVFSGDCELTTKTGTVNRNGVLEIPFVGENQMQKMMIRLRRNSIEITNTSDSPMMGLCRGATLAGIYSKR